MYAYTPYKFWLPTYMLCAVVDILEFGKKILSVFDSKKEFAGGYRPASVPRLFQGAGKTSLARHLI